MTALTVADVRKHYGDREALKGVTFSARPGERLAVIGPNGAGKTTLLQILAGALAPDGGAVDVARAGWVPQRPAVYGRLSVVGEPAAVRPAGEASPTSTARWRRCSR